MRKRNSWLWLTIVLVFCWVFAAQAYVNLQPYDSIWSDRLGCENEGRPITPFCEERRPPSVPGGYPEKKIYCALWDVYVPCGGGGGGAGCTPTGTNGEVLYLSSNDCGHDPGFTFDPTPDNLSLHLGTFGTGGAGILSLGKGTSPSTAPADSVQLLGEEITWVDAGIADTGLSVVHFGTDGTSLPLFRHHLGIQAIFGSNLQHSKQASGAVIDTGLIGGPYLCLKEDGGIAHGMTSLVDTDVGGCVDDIAGQGGLVLAGYTAATAAVRLAANAATEIAQVVHNTSAPLDFVALTKSGTTAGNMGVAKQVLTIRRGALHATPATDGTLMSLTSNGDMQVRGILGLNSHGEDGLSSSYGGSGTGKGAYIRNMGGGGLFLGMDGPNSSSDNGSGLASPVGLWTDETDNIPNGERVLLLAAGTNILEPTMSGLTHHVMIVPRGSRESGAINIDSENVGLFIIGPENSRNWIGDNRFGGDRASSGAGQAMTFKGESAALSSTNQAAGNAMVKSGTATGTGSGEVQLWSTPAGSSGMADNAAKKRWAVLSTGSLAGYGNTSGFVGILPPATVTSYTLTMPSVGPGAAECLGDSDGDDVLEWVACAGGGGSGDITDVWSCTTGNCSALTAASGDSLNAASADTTIPWKTGTATPGTCTVGEAFFDTDATAGLNVFGCTATNTWTLQGDGAGGGSGDITDVWSCTTGNCNALTAASGDTLNAGSADSTAPMKTGTAPPGTCTVGDFFFDTNATVGQNTYACTSTNTWTLQGDGAGSGTPGGANTQVQYNDSGAFAGSADFTWNDATATLTLNNGALNTTEVRTTGIYDISEELALAFQNSAGTAVNNFRLKNASTGNSPRLEVEGSDTDVTMVLASKGLGVIEIANNGDQQSIVRLNEDLDNGSNYVSLEVPASLAGNRTFRLPATNGNSGEFLQTDGNGVTSWAAAGGGGAASSQSEGARVRRAATQSITNATDTAISWDTEDFDDNSYYAGGAPTRLTIPATGWYTGCTSVDWDGNTGGSRFVHHAVNGTNAWVDQITAAVSDLQTRCWVERLTAGDYIETIVFQNSGTSRTLTARSSIVRWGQPAMPSSQTIAGGDTITADACGSIKRITSASGVTTDTTNTFTAPAAANAGCILHIVNVGSNSIILDNNANFKSAGAADVTLTADDSVVVGSTGASGFWYQMSPVSAN